MPSLKSQTVKDIAPSFGVAFLIAGAVYFLKYLPLTYYVVLPLQLGVGIGVFFAVCEGFQLPEYMEIKGIAKGYLMQTKNGENNSSKMPPILNSISRYGKMDSLDS